MTAEEIKKKDSEYIMHTYGRFDIVLDQGKGATLWDADGKQYVDLTSGIGVNSLGHGNPEIINAVTKQAEKLMHASNLYYTEPMVSVAEKLVTATGMGKIFFANSGAEANEGAIKLARKYSFDKYGEGRNTIVTPVLLPVHGRLCLREGKRPGGCNRKGRQDLLCGHDGDDPGRGRRSAVK